MKNEFRHQVEALELIEDLLGIRAEISNEELHIKIHTLNINTDNSDINDDELTDKEKLHNCATLVVDTLREHLESSYDYDYIIDSEEIVFIQF